MDEFKQVITIVAYGVEGFGVFIVVAGTLVATVQLLLQWRGASTTKLYQDYRNFIKRSMFLGLDFLIAGDVIRTIIVDHTLTSIGVLTLIVLVRTFLSFTLLMEIEGRLPWQKPASGQSG